MPHQFLDIEIQFCHGKIGNRRTPLSLKLVSDDQVREYLIGGKISEIPTPETRSMKGSHIFRTPFLKCFGGAFRYLFHRMGQQTTSADPSLLRRVRRRPVQVYRLSSFLPALFLPHIHVFEGPADDSGQNFDLLCHRQKLRTGKLVGLALVTGLD